MTTGAFGLMAQLSETFVFIYIGASVFLALPKYFSTAVFAVAMCFVSRWYVYFYLRMGNLYSMMIDAVFLSLQGRRVSRG